MSNNSSFKKFALILLGLLAAISMIFMIQSGQLFEWVFAKNNENITVIEDTEPNLDDKVLAKRSDEENFEKRVKEHKGKLPDNILVVGVDVPDTKDIKLKKNGATGVRTDTIMLVNVNETTNEVNVLSIPRDSRVLINGRKDKINHAHSYQGMDKLIEVIEDNFDINIDKYIRVDYRAVKKITEDIGGVDVVIKEPMVYKDPTPGLGVDINFQPGYYNLKGEDAIRFLRYRSSEGDLYRVKNQQYFIKKLIEKVYDMGPLNAGRIIIDSSLRYVDTNMSLSNIFGFLKLSSSISEDDINFHTLDGYGKYINNISYFIISDEQEILDIFKDNKE